MRLFQIATLLLAVFASACAKDVFDLAPTPAGGYEPVRYIDDVEIVSVDPPCGSAVTFAKGSGDIVAKVRWSTERFRPDYQTVWVFRSIDGVNPSGAFSGISMMKIPQGGDSGMGLVSVGKTSPTSPETSHLVARLVVRQGEGSQTREVEVLKTVVIPCSHSY